MAKEQQPTTPRRRTREELVVDTFRYMIRHGEAVRKEVTWLNAWGGTETKVIYKVEPNTNMFEQVSYSRNRTGVMVNL